MPQDIQTPPVHTVEAQLFYNLAVAPGPVSLPRLRFEYDFGHNQLQVHYHLS